LISGTAPASGFDDSHLLRRAVKRRAGWNVGDLLARATIHPLRALHHKIVERRAQPKKRQVGSGFRELVAPLEPSHAEKLKRGAENQAPPGSLS